MNKIIIKSCSYRKNNVKVCLYLYYYDTGTFEVVRADNEAGHSESSTDFYEALEYFNNQEIELATSGHELQTDIEVDTSSNPNREEIEVIIRRPLAKRSITLTMQKGEKPMMSWYGTSSVGAEEVQEFAQLFRAAQAGMSSLETFKY